MTDNRPTMTELADSIAAKIQAAPSFLPLYPVPEQIEFSATLDVRETRILKDAAKRNGVSPLDLLEANFARFLQSLDEEGA